jgi:predicted nucleic acid-binding protein
MVFFDSNVLVYIAINQDTAKKKVALQLVASAIENQSGYISLQVLREVANCMFKKSNDSIEHIRETLSGFDALDCLDESRDLLDRAIKIKDEYGIQFYDAMIVAAAEAAGCETLYSEDMGDGQIYGGIHIVNPFKTA